jgi:hypothetical protein
MFLKALEYHAIKFNLHLTDFLYYAWKGYKAKSDNKKPRK